MIYKVNENDNEIMTLEKEKVEIKDNYIFTYNKNGVMTGSHSLDKFVSISITE